MDEENKDTGRVMGLSSNRTDTVVCTIWNEEIARLMLWSQLIPTDSAVNIHDTDELSLAMRTGLGAKHH